MEMGCFVCAILETRMLELETKGQMVLMGSGSFDVSECYWGLLYHHGGLSATCCFN